MMKQMKSESRKKIDQLASHYFPYILMTVISICILGIFVVYGYWWKSDEIRIVCSSQQGIVSCLNEATRNQIEPEKVFGLTQKRKLYAGDGITLQFTGDGDPALLEPIIVAKASNINFNQPEHRKKVDSAAIEFTRRISKMRNPNATTETLVIVLDLTSGVDAAYRTKLGEYVQTRLTQNQSTGKFTDIRLFGCVQTPTLHSLNLSQVISSQQGVTEFIQSLPTQIPDSQELSASPLVETLWLILREFEGTSNLSVLFYSDLEQNTKTISLIREENRQFITNPAQLSKVVNQITADLGKAPQIPNLQHIEIVAMPGSRREVFGQLQPFWVEVFKRNSISSEKIRFQYPE